jgi:hypothetical protein
LAASGSLHHPTALPTFPKCAPLAMCEGLLCFLERKRPVHHRFHPVLPDRVAHRLKIFDGPDGHAAVAGVPTICGTSRGEFKLGNGRYCYPLTVTDHASRFLLLCEALDSTREDPAITAFERLFRDRGVQLAIRSDNGVPFASPNALFNLSKLSVPSPRVPLRCDLASARAAHRGCFDSERTGLPPKKWTGLSCF